MGQVPSVWGGAMEAVREVEGGEVMEVVAEGGAVGPRCDPAEGDPRQPAMTSFTAAFAGADVSLKESAVSGDLADGGHTVQDPRMAPQGQTLDGSLPPPALLSQSCIYYPGFQLRLRRVCPKCAL